MEVTIKPLISYDPALAAQYLHWFNDVALANDIAPFGGLPDTAAACAEWMRWLATTNLEKRFTLYVEGMELPIGDCGLTTIDPVHCDAGVSIFIAEPSLRGQGLGKLVLKRLIRYAFSEMGLSSLYLSTDVDNTRAVQAYQSVGFVTTSVTDTVRWDGSLYRQMIMELKKL